MQQIQINWKILQNNNGQLLQNIDFMHKSYLKLQQTTVQLDSLNRQQSIDCRIILKSQQQHELYLEYFQRYQYLYSEIVKTLQQNTQLHKQISRNASLILQNNEQQYSQVLAKLTQLLKQALNHSSLNQYLIKVFQTNQPIQYNYLIALIKYAGKINDI